MASFRWENATKFISLANLLSLRSGACLGPRDRRDDETEDDMESTHACAGGEGELRERLLDRLAEVMAGDKGGKHVACVALCESRNCLDHDVEEPNGTKATLLVARNEAFRDVDRSFCNTIERLLATIATSARTGAKNLGAETALWEELLKYNVPRLEHYAINFQQSVATFTLSGFLDSIPPYYITQSLRVTDEVENFCDSDDIGPYSKSTHRIYMKFAQAHIQELRAILCSGDRAAQLCLLAKKAHSIRHMVSVQMFINSCSIYDSRARKLLSDIHFLGRLRSCYLTLIEAAETIASFCNVSIVPVDHPPLYIHRPILPPLETVFGWADLTLNQNTVQKFVDANATVISVEQSFKERRREASSKPLSVHAEIQLVFHIAKTIGSLATMKEVYPYIGCSKLCCFLCYVFILSFGQGGSLFRIRGCHGKVYPSWSLPNADGLQENMATELHAALLNTLNILVREMKKPVILIPLHVAESSADVSDDYAARSSYVHAYRRDLAVQCEFDALRTKLLGTSLGEMALTPTKDLEVKGNESEQFTYFPTRTGKCARCGKQTSRKCSRCSGPWLCRKACEMAYDFYEHNFTCAIRRPLDSADYLERACWRNEIPADLDALEDFGFTKFASAFDQMKLLGVFVGLTRMGVGNRELRQWKEEGTLTANIVSKYEAEPDRCWGHYYPWLQKHLHILNHHTKLPPPDLFDVVRPYLDPDDRSKYLHELMPDAKRKSFLLYAILCNGWHPDPGHSETSIQDLYFTFGFCVCWNHEAEQELAKLYMILFLKCSFQEFWSAYQSNSLVFLMDANWLSTERNNIPHLNTFLSIRPGDWCPTVWHLRLFTQSRVTVPGRYVAADYGFLNCKTVEEEFALKATYTHLLETPRVDPMELHTACVKGELYRFASLYLPNLEQRFRRLMRNPYPLQIDNEWVGRWRLPSLVHSQSGW